MFVGTGGSLANVAIDTLIGANGTLCTTGS
jgi:hypothetical protein